MIYCLYKMQLFYWLLCVAKSCDWSRKITPPSNATWKSLLVEWKLTAKAELNCKICKSCRKYWKSQVSFVIRAALWAENLGRCLENCRSWKNTFGKLAVAVNLEAIRFEIWLNERSVSDGGNLCHLRLVILKSVWNSVRDFFKLRYSWPWAVASYTFLSTVPWNELEHSHRKVRLCTDFKKWCFNVSFLTSISVSTIYFETEESWSF